MSEAVVPSSIADLQNALYLLSCYASDLFEEATRAKHEHERYGAPLKSEWPGFVPGDDRLRLGGPDQLSADHPHRLPYVGKKSHFAMWKKRQIGWPNILDQLEETLTKFWRQHKACSDALAELPAEVVGDLEARTGKYWQSRVRSTLLELAKWPRETLHTYTKSRPATFFRQKNSKKSENKFTDQIKTPARVEGQRIVHLPGILRSIDKGMPDWDKHLQDINQYYEDLAAVFWTEQTSNSGTSTLPKKPGKSHHSAVPHLKPCLKNAHQAHGMAVEYLQEMGIDYGEKQLFEWVREYDWSKVSGMKSYIPPKSQSTFFKYVNLVDNLLHRLQNEQP